MLDKLITNYKGIDDWNNQPTENFIGIRLINWFKADNNI